MGTEYDFWTDWAGVRYLLLRCLKYGEQGDQVVWDVAIPLKKLKEELEKLDG